MDSQHIVIICGATASGKSKLALELAEKTGGVIINADSQQLYADLRILTARPSPEEEARAPHRLYGMLTATESPSAGKWLRLAKMEIDWALSQGKLPIVVGGTGLYLKALMEGMAEIPDIDPAVVRQAESDYGSMGKPAFEERLRAVDPAFFERLKVYDRQRLVRAYSVWLGSGKSLSWWQAQGSNPPYPNARFEMRVVEVSRETLYARCDGRFTLMLEQGALEEVRQLLYSKIPEEALIHKVIGVPELSAHLRGELTLEEAAAKAQQATRNYAKRQMTWFRNQIDSK